MTIVTRALAVGTFRKQEPKKMYLGGKRLSHVEKTCKKNFNMKFFLNNMKKHKRMAMVKK
jgi:hypothetical protein